MSDQVAAWHKAARELGLEIVAPFEMDLDLAGRLSATALIKDFEARQGMVVDPLWSTLEPYASALHEAGYGYSAMELGEYDRTYLIGVFNDWGWTGSRGSRLER
jgi:hypothetical protein